MGVKKLQVRTKKEQKAIEDMKKLKQEKPKSINDLLKRIERIEEYLGIR